MSGKRSRCLPLFALAVLAGCETAPVSAPPPAYGGTVQVIDGDTLDVSGHRLRLFGIDAFELRQYCGDYPCGVAARAYLDILIVNRAVQCTTKGSVTPISAVCRIGTLDLNDAMVRAGWALALRTESVDYVEAENEARRNFVGAWNTEFEPPWAW